MTKRLLGLLLLAACAGADSADDVDVDESVESGELAQEQASPAAADSACRPIRHADCTNFDNDRACFYVPTDCPSTTEPE